MVQNGLILPSEGRLRGKTAFKKFIPREKEGSQGAKMTQIREASSRHSGRNSRKGRARGRALFFLWKCLQGRFTGRASFSLPFPPHSLRASANSPALILLGKLLSQEGLQGIPENPPLAAGGEDKAQ